MTNMMGKHVTVLQIHECCQDGRGRTHHRSGSEAGTDVGVCHRGPHQQGHREAYSTRKAHETPRQQLTVFFLCLSVDHMIMSLYCHNNGL